MKIIYASVQHKQPYILFALLAMIRTLTLPVSLVGGGRPDVDIAVAGSSDAIEERSQEGIAIGGVESPNESFHVLHAETLRVLLIPNQCVDL